MNEVLKFEINKVELLEEVNNSQLTKVRMGIVSEGDNKHNMPIDWECINMAKETLIGKPVLCYYKSDGTFGGHEPEEKPVGVIISKDDIFEQEIEGKRWLFADAYLWKQYFPEVIENLKNNNGESNISMEIQLLETELNELGQECIKLMAFQGVTLIGVPPAIEGAKATVLRFSELVEQTKDIIKTFSENNSIKINNSKESAVNGSWSNPGTKLYKPILKAANKNSLVHEAYGEVLDGYEDSPSTKLKYPHHVIRNEELVLHIKGVEAGFARARQQGLSGEIINHFKKHYKELDLDISNFSEFEEKQNISISNKEEFTKISKKEDGKMELAKSPEMFAKIQEYCNSMKYEALDYSEDFMFCFDKAEKKMYAIPYTRSDEKFEANIDGKKNAKLRVNYEATDEEVDMTGMMSLLNTFDTDANAEPAAQIARSKQETEGDKEAIAKDKKNDNDEDDKETQAKMAELESKFSALETENKELKEFKENILKQENESKIEFAINEVSETMPKEKVDEWREKVIEFSCVDAWSNALKADAFNYVKQNPGNNKENIIRMGLPYSDTKQKEKKSVWED